MTPQSLVALDSPKQTVTKSGNLLDGIKIYYHKLPFFLKFIQVLISYIAFTWKISTFQKELFLLHFLWQNLITILYYCLTGFISNFQ